MFAESLRARYHLLAARSVRGTQHIPTKYMTKWQRKYYLKWMKRSKHAFTFKTPLLFHEHKHITTRDSVRTSWHLGRSVPPFCKQTHPSLEVLFSPKGNDIRQVSWQTDASLPLGHGLLLITWVWFQSVFWMTCSFCLLPTIHTTTTHSHRRTLMNM